MEKTVHDIIIRPIITEASVDALADRKYTFEVAKNANKIEIRRLSSSFSRMLRWKR